MGYLRINKIKYLGDKYYFESEELKKDIILIEGDNGTGKSTLCDLIYYALSGEVTFFRRNSEIRHIQITSDTNNYVELYTTISGENYILRRNIDDNDILVIPYKKLLYTENEQEIETIEFCTEETVIYPINRNNNYIFSDWILEKLGISVVQLFYGYTTFKINFIDLMRLIYHDQQPDPKDIYKRIDSASRQMIGDSLLLRKAIFELMIGKSYSEYYDSITEEKRLDKEKDLARNLVNEYKSLIDNFRKDSEPKNISFLQLEIQQLEEQLEKLHQARSSFKRNRTNPKMIDSTIDSYKNELIETELLLSDNKEKLLYLLDEKYKLIALKMEAKNEISQIQKVILAHDQLNLFTADTCPYCLNKVEREHNHCVCGAEIKEDQYERFFYTSLEYKEILKSKIKSNETIKVAYQSCDQEIKDIEISISRLKMNLTGLKEKLLLALEQIDEPVDIETINDIDDKILDVRERIANLIQLLEFEQKLKKYQDNYESISKDYQKAMLNRQLLETKAQQDINEQVNLFSEIYSELMVSTLSECRSAKISLDNYLPIINDGVYREASSGVPKRLMYYITLMHLALLDDAVSFPRFLLIDTPETAGIEAQNLVNCIGKIQDLDKYNKPYQVILTTGLGKYPESLTDNRILYLTKQNKLLKERVG